MSFLHSSDTAADIPDYFVRLELFLRQLGWIHVSGTGTTDIIYRTTGELNNLTKLYVRVWRDGGVPGRIYGRIQDDAAGTHATTVAAFLGSLNVAGGGAVPFTYWLSGDKNCFIQVVLNGAENYCMYTGAVEPFSLSITDETMRFIIATHCTSDLTRPFARLLRRYDNTWDYSLRVGGIQHTAIETLSNSRTLTGCYAYNTADNSENYGMLYYITYYIHAALGMVQGDTVTSGYPSEVTSQWRVFSNSLTGVKIWAVMTSVKIPLGKPEDTYTVNLSLVTDWTDFDNKLVAILTSLGWVSANWHAPTYTIDRYWTSTGESGAEDIRLRIGQMTTNIYMACVNQNTPGFQTTTISVSQIADTAFPAIVYFIADKNCILICVIQGVQARWSWAGKPVTYYPDESVIPFEYKEISVEDVASPYILRSWNGLWNRTIAEVTDAMANSSPNRVDGTTFVIWPKTYTDSNTLLHTLKYLYNVSSDNLCLGDIIYVGEKGFRYIALNLAIREE